VDEERVVKYRIKKIPALRTSKVAAIICAPFGLIYTLIGVVVLAAPRTTPATVSGTIEVMVGQILLAGPVLLAAFTFIATLFTCWFYNRVANSIGGIEMELGEIPSITIKQMKKDLAAAERRRGKDRGE
jgi:hypothetical protein